MANPIFMKYGSRIADIGSNMSETMYYGVLLLNKQLWSHFGFEIRC